MLQYIYPGKKETTFPNVFLLYLYVKNCSSALFYINREYTAERNLTPIISLYLSFYISLRQRLTNQNVSFKTQQNSILLVMSYIFQRYDFIPKDHLSLRFYWQNTRCTSRNPFLHFFSEELTLIFLLFWTS